MGEASNYAQCDRIAGAVENNWNCRGSLLCSEGSRVAALCYDHVDLAGDQVGSQGGQPVEAPLRPAVFDQDVLPFNKTQLAQPFAKTRKIELYRPELRRDRAKHTDHRHRFLLRTGNERPYIAVPPSKAIRSRRFI